MIIFISIFIFHFNFFGCWPAQDLSLYFSESREGGRSGDLIIKQPLSPVSINPGPKESPRASGDADAGTEVAAVLRGGVEDKGWLFADSDDNLRRTLGAYFTGHLLEKLICSARDFKGKQTDWQTTTTLEEYAIDFQGGDQALARVLIADTDPLNGEKKLYAMEYYLVKTSLGWRIAGMLRNSNY